MNSEKGYIYRIKLSENMLRQGYKEFDKKEFETFDKAYNFVCEKWGSSVFRTPLGLTMQMAKIGTNDWEDFNGYI